MGRLIMLPVEIENFKYKKSTAKQLKVQLRSDAPFSAIKWCGCQKTPDGFSIGLQQ